MYVSRSHCKSFTWECSGVLFACRSAKHTITLLAFQYYAQVNLYVLKLSKQRFKTTYKVVSDRNVNNQYMLIKMSQIICFFNKCVLFLLQSVSITTTVVSSNPAHCEVYSIQLYVIKFASSVVLSGYSGFLHQ